MVFQLSACHVASSGSSVLLSFSKLTLLLIIAVKELYSITIDFSKEFFRRCVEYDNSRLGRLFPIGAGESTSANKSSAVGPSHRIHLHASVASSPYRLWTIKIRLIKNTIDLSGPETNGTTSLDACNLHKQQLEDRSRHSAVGTPDYCPLKFFLALSMVMQSGTPESEDAKLKKQLCDAKCRTSVNMTSLRLRLKFYRGQWYMHWH
ncbi:hypothetical protein F3Y22_tig00111027pilonHSYRG00293 [Hibiscus syriacus]|uniref:Uncharacterized protein n=1 Tax=Hibiscus syriacus TaxID=106335 RepID=A0A6A2Z4D8_HIBSY|nr:hypothetical protein F3Y22_tig00111027pilonHSYRG00293 [Hibiscus syriacus]